VSIDLDDVVRVLGRAHVARLCREPGEPMVLLPPRIRRHLARRPKSLRREGTRIAPVWLRSEIDAVYEAARAEARRRGLIITTPKEGSPHG
jgi:hypothetical protein